MHIGIAGTGRMGTAMGERLLAQGHELTVWNRTEAHTATLVAAGAAKVEAARDLPGKVEVVITSLADAAAVRAVYADLLEGDAEGTLFVDTSTVRPLVAVEIGAAVRAAGGAFVECPVGGTTGPAKQGKLIGLVGAEAADLERARPVLSELCRRIEHAGAVGTGASLKLAINLPLIAYWQVFGEALALVRPLGLSGAVLTDLFADSSGGPNVLKNRAEPIAKALDASAPPGTFDLDTMRKDLREMLAEAEALGLALPVARTVLAEADRCAAAGHGDRDGIALSLQARDGSA